MGSGETTAERPHIHEVAAAFPDRALGLVECLRCAWHERTDAITEEEPDSFTRSPSPRWPSSIPALDELLGGGFYGLTALSGPFGSGKSLLAIATALEAVRAGWLVVYFNAELPQSMMTNRVLAYAGRLTAAERDRFQLRGLSPGFKPQDLFREMMHAFAYWPEAQNILGVFDSINSIARMSMREHDSYFDRLQKLGQTAVQARKHSEGGCGFLYVSEQNKQGELKGLQLQYDADVVVNFKTSSVRNQVEIDVAKSRESATRNLGTYVRDFHRGRFVRLLGQPVEQYGEEEIL